MNHGKAAVCAVAYDMYKECAEGNLQEEWAVAKPVSFHRFREKLSKQALTYAPRKNEYAGDVYFRDFTRTPKRKRTAASRSPASSRSRSPASSAGSSSGSVNSRNTGVTFDLVESHTKTGRLCGFIGRLRNHIASVKPIDKNGHRQCAVCGQTVYQMCQECGGVALHHANTIEELLDQSSCFYVYHDTGCVGIPREDWRCNFRRKSDWKLPQSNGVWKEHYACVERLCKQHIIEQSARNGGSSSTNRASDVPNRSNGNNRDTSNNSGR